MTWPDWCADRPLPGSSIAAGQPLCTIEAEGNRRGEVEALIARRKAALWRRLAAHG
jgi:predicted ATP-grasp superfamily ATP-dependent carboligase